MSRAERRQKFQPGFFRNLHPSRDVLRLLRSLQTATDGVMTHMNFSGV